MLFEFKMAISGVIVAIPSGFLWSMHGDYLEKNPNKRTWGRKIYQLVIEWIMCTAIVTPIIYVTLGLLHMVWGWK